MIARPIRRTGPIPFAPLTAISDGLLVAANGDPGDRRETRLRSRWLTPHLACRPALAAMPPRIEFTSPHQGSSGLAVNAIASGQPGPTAGRGGHCGHSDSARLPQFGCHAIYHGQGTLNVLSSVTGHHYRFEGRGCTLSIDPRDCMVLGRLNELSIHPTRS